MITPDSRYAKPFLTVPEQIARLRQRGMDCGTDEYARGVMERYGYYRLSGYSHPYRKRPESRAERVDADGRDIRLDSFVGGTSLAHIVAMHEFDQEVRDRVSAVLRAIETSFRFFIGHRLGRTDRFAHRRPDLLGAMRTTDHGEPTEPTTAYREWLEEYDRHEKRARDVFVLHFRDKYGPHLPIWVATEVMSLGVLSNLYGLMPQLDQEVLAARLQLKAADGRGDRVALANWLNNLRNVRNICAHYGRLWNRTFDVLIEAPGQVKREADGHLSGLVDAGVNNKLYGVLLIMRHLLLSIDPNDSAVIDIAEFIDDRSRRVRFTIGQLGFPVEWKAEAVWDRSFRLDRTPMMAASLLDRTTFLTAPQTRAVLTAARPEPTDHVRTPQQETAAMRGAQKSLLRTYIHYRVVIEVELGGTKFYPAFQFRDGTIINTLAEINKTLCARAADADEPDVAAGLLGWWLSPHPDLPKDADGGLQSPVSLLETLSEAAFIRVIARSDATSSFAAPVAEALRAKRRSS